MPASLTTALAVAVVAVVTKYIFLTKNQAHTMKPNKLIGLMAVGLILPSTAIAFGDSVLAKEVRVKTANVEAVTRSDGSVYVNTEGTTVSVPRRNTRRYWNPIRYWQLPWHFGSDREALNKSNRHCHQTTYQSTQQTTQSGTVQHSSYSNNCN